MSKHTKESKKIKKEQKLNHWTQVDDNLYFFKDKEKTVWELLRTPYKEIPITKSSPR